MPYCCVVGCKNGDGSGRSFYRFPKETQMRRRQEWMERVGRIDWEPSRTAVVCSDHFGRDAFVTDPKLLESLGSDRQRRLNKDAVPSIFAYRNEEEEKLRMFKKGRQFKVPI
ncbi:hypothetical protein LSAT2_016024 [Lamellibrachia satsuma]|nr:hypothetical protein LSAT2_016024 [Lamellibrachia satsuma]